jgi:hypothetical protein
VNFAVDYSDTNYIVNSVVNCGEPPIHCTAVRRHFPVELQCAPFGYCATTTVLPLSFALMT